MPADGVGASPARERPAASIAVLPFLDLTPTGAPHLADGLADDIISGLATVRGLRVTSRASAFGFRERAVPTSRIGEELGVATILEGSVRLVGSQVLVTAQLIATDTEERVWSQRYDRDVRDLFAIQQDIVERASRILSVELTASDRQRLANRSGSPEAFQLYLRGRYHGSQGSTDGWERAVECYRLALEADPTYALGYAGLADAHLQLPLFQFMPPIPRAAALERAKLAAARAIELDSELGEAHAALGVARWYDWDWRGAERSMQRAIQLNSAAAAVRQRYGVMLASLGRFEAAARELRRASELDPLSLYVAVDRGLVELRGRRFDLAIAHFEKVLALNPAFPPALHYLAEARTYGGRTEPSARQAPPVPGETWHGLGHAESSRLDDLFRECATSEQHAERASLLERTDAAPTIIAAAWGRAGQVDRGWSWLDRAAEERDPTLADGVRLHPGLDAFRGTDRWKVLLRRLNVDDAGSWSE